jgi:hypothetical protein
MCFAVPAEMAVPTSPVKLATELYVVPPSYETANATLEEPPNRL